MHIFFVKPFKKKKKKKTVKRKKNGRAKNKQSTVKAGTTKAKAATRATAAVVATKPKQEKAPYKNAKRRTRSGRRGVGSSRFRYCRSIGTKRKVVCSWTAR